MRKRIHEKLRRHFVRRHADRWSEGTMAIVCITFFGVGLGLSFLGNALLLTTWLLLGITGLSVLSVKTKAPD